MKPYLLSLCAVLSAWHSIQAAPYRSRADGDWSDESVWEIDDGYWQNASTPPGASDEVYIRSGHSIVIEAAHAEAAAIDVAANASLILGTNRNLSLYNGWVGADLRVWGLFQDHAGSNFGTDFFGGTWLLGPAGTFIKSNNSSSIGYRDYYEGGMDQIPSTADWVIQYTGVGSPSFSTINTYYPNLSFQSSAGAWNPSLVFSRFQGTNGTAVVYGNLSVGAGVTLYNENTNAQPIEVFGDLYVAGGGLITNQGQETGTGFAVHGSVQIDGGLSLNGGGSGGLLYMQGNYLGGSGSISLYNLEVQSSGALSLGRSLWVENELGLWAGQIQLNQYDLRVDGEIWGYHSSRYIQTNDVGSLILPGAGSLYYPIGNDQFNPLLVNYYGYQLARLRVSEGVRSQGSSGDWIWSSVVQVSWQWAGEPGSFDVFAQWSAGQESGDFNRSQSYLSYYQQSWTGGLPQAASGNNPYQQSRDGLAGAGVLTVASSGALPADWGDFTATLLGSSQVQLHWKTWQESQTAYFHLERSEDGRRFERIASLAAAGFSQSERLYTYTYPHERAAYYRVQLEDVDGQISYSKLQYLDAAAGGGLRVFPALCQQELYLQASEAAALLYPTLLYPRVFYLCDQQGRCGTLTFTHTAEIWQLDVSQLVPGLYTICDKSGQSARFVKQ